jgi:hypothetical protein
VHGRAEGQQRDLLRGGGGGLDGAGDGGQRGRDDLLGSCSAMPGSVQRTGYSSACWATTLPSSVKTTVLVLVVPISTPSM